MALFYLMEIKQIQAPFLQLDKTETVFFFIDLFQSNNHTDVYRFVVSILFSLSNYVRKKHTTDDNQ
jgi:hypothetical protein